MIFFTSASALTSISKSICCRISEICPCRFWLMRTKIDKKIASSETIIVRRPNGNGSNGSKPNTPIFHSIQPTKSTALPIRNQVLPNCAVSVSAIRSMRSRLNSSRDMTFDIWLFCVRRFVFLVRHDMRAYYASTTRVSTSVSDGDVKGGASG